MSLCTVGLGMRDGWGFLGSHTLVRSPDSSFPLPSCSLSLTLRIQGKQMLGCRKSPLTQKKLDSSFILPLCRAPAHPSQLSAYLRLGIGQGKNSPPQSSVLLA